MCLLLAVLNSTLPALLNSAMNPVPFKFIIFTLCLVLVCGEQKIRCIQREREALLQFKTAVVDRYGMLSSWTTADCCEWERIRCSNLTGHVLMLDLHANISYYDDYQNWMYLSGKIHRSLMDLPQLMYLNLSLNSFSGNIPSQLGNLSNLLYLDLSGNSFEGTIPSQLGNLSNLQYLDLTGNDFEGNIPSQLGNLSNLQYLGLRGNSFEGNIPSQLGNLSNLNQLSLGGAFYSGTLKMNDGGQWMSNLIFLTHLSLVSISNLSTSHTWLQMIAKLPKLRHLNLINCSLSDNFILSLRPSKFNFSSSLSLLDLSENTFTSSTVFPWVSNITSHLVELDLSYNNLTEDLPSILHNLSSGCVSHSLQDLDLRYNRITGTLPDLSVFSSLKSLLLGGNQLSGKITEGIRLPPKLERLSISSNSLEGGIPKSFGSTCTLESVGLSDNKLTEELTVILNHLSGCSRYSLQEVYLSVNQITGTLPNLLSSFPSLRRLHLRQNNLNGTISKDLRFPTELEELDLSSNSLKGVITDSHFANMSKLKSLELSDNSLTLAFTQNWVPYFQLAKIRLRSCNLGPAFPKWLRTQYDFNYLDISNASISDIVPKWFWAKLALGAQYEVDISSNNLQGIIPSLPLKIHPLSSLSLGSNQFEGPIPPFLRGYEILDLSKNKFSDSDSLSFLCASGAAENLYQLDLSNNELSGQIPDCWSHFKSLAYLNLSYNKFSGKIPTSMGSLLELQALSLRSNDLTGVVPFSLSNCTKLVMLDMAENRLSGPIPSWIGSELQELQILSLGGNRFYGWLPLQICYLKSVQLLDLSQNNLFGQIPKCIKNFTSMAQKTLSREYRDQSYLVNITGGSRILQYYDLNAFLMWKGSEQMFMHNGLSLLKSIDFSRNHFSEEIPTEIEYLFGLVSLNLSGNNLTGKIPSNIGKLTSLEFLDLSRNHLVGSIPSSLTQIDRLTMLNVSHNHLSGMIPTGTQLQSFDASSYEDNDLCGPPLKKLCIDGKRAQEPIVKLDDDEYVFFSREFYMSMAIGFVISFWGVFGSILIKRS